MEAAILDCITNSPASLNPACTKVNEVQVPEYSSAAVIVPGLAEGTVVLILHHAAALPLLNENHTIVSSAVNGPQPLTVNGKGVCSAALRRELFGKRGRDAQCEQQEQLPCPFEGLFHSQGIGCL